LLRIIIHSSFFASFFFSPFPPSLPLSMIWVIHSSIYSMLRGAASCSRLRAPWSVVCGVLFWLVGDVMRCWVYSWIRLDQPRPPVFVHQGHTIHPSIHPSIHTDGHIPLFDLKCSLQEGGRPPSSFRRNHTGLSCVLPLVRHSRGSFACHPKVRQAGR
jgi:hypothetical protein